jgi:hypothetical protein
MLESFLLITAIYLYFFIQAIRLLMWIPGAIRKLKKGETSFSIPFMNAILWAIFSFLLLLNSLDALRDQPCWFLCELDSNTSLLMRLIALYLVANTFLFVLIGLAVWRDRISKHQPSTQTDEHIEDHFVR